MNKIVLGLLALGTLFLVPAWAQSPSDRKTSQDVRQVQKDYEAKVRKDLKEIGAKIRRLKNQAAKAGEKAKADMDRDIGKLETQKKVADRKLVELGKATGDAWKDLQRGLDGAVSNLKKAVQDSADRFKAMK